MTAGTHNFTGAYALEKGATFARTITISDSGAVRNLTGYDARMKIKDQQGNTLFNLTVGSGITIPTPANGQVLISISDTETAAITAFVGSYDLEIESGAGVTTRLLEGLIEFRPQVTD